MNNSVIVREKRKHFVNLIEIKKKRKKKNFPLYILCLRSILASDVTWPKLPVQNYNALNFMASIIHLMHLSCDLRQESI